MQKTWKIKEKYDGENILDTVLRLRGFDKNEFLKPIPVENIFDFLSEELKEGVALIKKHIKLGSKIFIHGDYDVDGICATSILFNTLTKDLGYKNCEYFIPDRFEDGYGLSKESINKLLGGETKLLITVDCGITAVESCEYAKEKGFDVIITDHHQKPEALPKPDVLIWSDKLCGSGVALGLSKALVGLKDEYVALAAFATVTDMLSLSGLNRSIVKYGLEKLNETPPLGIKKLLALSSFSGKISTYELGWILGPRFNAAGRLESALNSLKLLITSDENEAAFFAETLNKMNYERQQKTFSMFEHAKSVVDSEKKLLLVKSPDYHEGVIGLVAGKLTQAFHKPAVAISMGVEMSKGSARSIEGVNIIELLRSVGECLDKVGGHPMAAGFSIKNSALPKFCERLEKASENIDAELLKPVLNIDLEIPLNIISFDLLNSLKNLEPFGFGNAEPVFTTSGIKVVNAYCVGSKGDHLKMKLTDDSGKFYNAIFFGGGACKENLEDGKPVSVAYSIRENTFNGYTNIDLQIKDLKVS